MLNIHLVSFQVIDRGVTCDSFKPREVIVKPGSDLKVALIKDLKKDRRSMDLTTKFNVNITNQVHIGWK